jgi:hypothetical protein
VHARIRAEVKLMTAKHALTAFRRVCVNDMEKAVFVNEEMLHCYRLEVVVQSISVRILRFGRDVFDHLFRFPLRANHAAIDADLQG